VASAANIDLQLGHRAAGGEAAAAAAFDDGHHVLGMDILFHRLVPPKERRRIVFKEASNYRALSRPQQGHENGRKRQTRAWA
jgi:hypothetical protein